MTTNAKSASKNRLGVVGKKLGMTQVFDEQGLAIPVTVIKVDPLTVTQVKTVDTDGYNAIQVGFEPAKEKHLTKAQIGHFAKNGLDNFRHLQEFRVENSAEYTVGQQIDLSILENVESYDNDTLFASLTPLSEKLGLKTGAVMWCIRIAVSGLMATPGGATEIMEVIGKEETIARIKTAIQKL
jgi:glutamyl/glutaminyl-tRNA synthetase